MNSGFDERDLARSRSYHRPLYAALGVDLALGLGVLALLALAVPLDWTGALPWWAAAALLAALTAALPALARLPVALFRRRHEHRWELSDQRAADWWLDRAKGLAVAIVLAVVALLPLVALARALPHWWPAVAAAAAALFVLLVGFVAPVVLEPVFNRFAPLADESLARELHALSERAGVPVREVLVADASRRTRKHNAYVSGLGRTRRVVLWDTLLEDADRGEVRLVVAHELAHRRYRHVAAFTLLGMAGAGGFVLVLRALSIDVADPKRVPLVVLVGSLLEAFATPFGAALSRRFERAADAFALRLTGDLETYVRTFTELARANLADLAPPRLLYLALFSHPTAPERIAAGRATAR